MDSSIIQGPFSVAPCHTLISRFATFPSPYVLRFCDASLRSVRLFLVLLFALCCIKATL